MKSDTVFQGIMCNIPSFAFFTFLSGIFLGSTFIAANSYRLPTLNLLAVQQLDVISFSCFSEYKLPSVTEELSEDKNYLQKPLAQYYGVSL